MRDRTSLEQGLGRAIDLGRDALQPLLGPNGALPDRTDVGPSYTAFPLIAMHYAGCALPRAQRDKVVHWLKRQQRRDGSFGAYPFATGGDLCATASVWAAFHCAGLDESDPAMRHAKEYLDQHGGLDAVARALFEQTNFAALFVAMAGLIDPSKLPLPPPGLFLTPPVEALLRKRFDYLTLIGALVSAGAIVDELRRRKASAAAAEAASHGFFGEVESIFRKLANHAGETVEKLDDGPCIAFLRSYQNPNGSLDDTTLQTGLLLGGLFALRLPADDSSVQRAAQWMRDMLVESNDEAWWNGFTGDVWSTALAGRALIAADVSRDDAAITSMVSWFLDCQIADEQLVRNTSKPGARKTGGWAFESSNVTMPDCDDTGLVLATLGICSAEPARGGKLPDALASRVLTAVERATEWLEGNQHPDGGWSAFDYWEGEKPVGPMYTTEIGLFGGGFLSTLENLVAPPIGLGAPSWEDVTARVLYGLGFAGYDVASPVAAKAIRFLAHQQLSHGGWWGRWMVNYLPTTAYVLLGLDSVGMPHDDEMITRAIAFVKRHQNADGGWGEDEETYRYPERAGKGPSMPPLTGLVVTALVAVGEGDSDAVANGIAYLLREQRSDGTWPNNDWLHAFFPPQSFYHYERMTALYPLEALGRFRQFLRGDDAAPGDPTYVGPPAPQPPTEPRWSDTFLDGMRQVGDALADGVIVQLFAANQTDAVNRLMMTLIRSDEPVPAGLPDEVRRYFDTTSALPAFADLAQIGVAQRLFARAGWSIAASLFCSSLPQTYAAARGAKVLTFSGRMDHDVRHRILETAQFIFDVTDTGGIDSPNGRGVRSAQKVRLMHATVRHLTLHQPRWDLADGIPINQEDLAATLMSFSVVILEALERLRIVVTKDEAEAWLHLWKCVGALMGVVPELLPRDVADGNALMDAFRRRQWDRSPQGVQLARALTSCMASYVPGPMLDRLPTTLVRHLAGDRCADVLGLPQANWTAAILDLAKDVLGIVDVFDRNDRDEHVAALIERFSNGMMKAIVDAQRGGKHAPFRMPASLRST